MTQTQAEAPTLGDRLSGLFADLQFQIGGLGDEMRKQRSERYEILQNVYPVSIPAQSVQVPSGGALLITSPEVLGPRTGIAWDVRRISVFGLASTSESVNVFKVSGGGGAAAAAQNYVTTLIGPNSYFGPGLGAFMLRAGESILVSGASLTANEWVTISGDAISVAERWLGAYLL